MVCDVVEHNNVKGGLTEILGQDIPGAISDPVGHAVACRDYGRAIYRSGQFQDGAL